MHGAVEGWTWRCSGRAFSMNNSPQYTDSAAPHSAGAHPAAARATSAAASPLCFSVSVYVDEHAANSVSARWNASSSAARPSNVGRMDCMRPCV